MHCVDDAVFAQSSCFCGGGDCTKGRFLCTKLQSKAHKCTLILHVLTVGERFNRAGTPPLEQVRYEHEYLQTRGIKGAEIVRAQGSNWLHGIAHLARFAIWGGFCGRLLFESCFTRMLRIHLSQCLEPKTSHQYNSIEATSATKLFQ
eukprot:6463710-Amphidinium_carterae.2